MSLLLLFRPHVAEVTATTPAKPVIHSQALREASAGRGRRSRPQILRAVSVPRAERRVLVSTPDRGRLRRLGRQLAFITRPPWTGVPRTKTVKGILVRPVERAMLSRRRRHKPVILRAGAVVSRRQVLVRSQRRSAARAELRRHRSIILRGALTIARSARQRTAIVRSRPRVLLARRPAVILRAPRAPSVVAAGETIKHIYVRGQNLRRKVIGRANHHKPFITRPTVTGVPRAKTIKAIYLHGVGRAEQIAKHRRHRPLIVRSAQRITTPVGRVVLRSVDRSKSGRLRRHKLAIIFRSRGGTPAVVAQATIKAIYVRAVSRQAEARKRRHKALVLRAPLRVTTRGGTTILRPVKRRTSGRLRRHRIFLFRSRETGLNRRTIKPILVHGIRRRHVAELRRHEVEILRSREGVAVVAGFTLGHFDEPTPAGSFFDEPTPGAAGFDRASPSAAVMDRPTPGAAAFDEPTPTAGHFDEPTPT